MSNNKLKAFVRLDGQNRVISSSVVYDKINLKQVDGEKLQGMNVVQ